MVRLFKHSLGITFFMGVILCGAYPVCVTVLGQILFPHQAKGSLMIVGGRPIGSEWVGQTFTSAKYFHGRPSAAGAGYDAQNSSSANLGPTSKKLMERIQADIDQILKKYPQAKKGEIPTDLVTSSGSGLDPHISVESALLQLPSVAQARAQRGEDLSQSMKRIQELIEKNTERPFLGFLGEERVHVLKLNLALDGP